MVAKLKLICVLYNKQEAALRHNNEGEDGKEGKTEMCSLKFNVTLKRNAEDILLLLKPISSALDKI